jgi:hypothetical protein
MLVRAVCTHGVNFLGAALVVLLDTFMFQYAQMLNFVCSGSGEYVLLPLNRVEEMTLNSVDFFFFDGGLACSRP